MNIQRSVLEGEITAVSSLGRGGGLSWAELLGEAGRTGLNTSRAAPGPGRRSRVPDEDIVLVGRARGGGPKAPNLETAPAESAVQRRPALPVRTTLLLGVAAYYMAWGLYQGIATHKPRAIHVNPTLNSKTVIT